MEGIKDTALSSPSPTDIRFVMIQTAHRQRKHSLPSTEMSTVSITTLFTDILYNLTMTVQTHTSLFPTAYADYIWVTLPSGIKGNCLISESDAYIFCVSGCIQVRFKVLIRDWRIECRPYGLYSMGCDWNADHVDPDG